MSYDYLPSHRCTALPSKSAQTRHSTNKRPPTTQSASVAGPTRSSTTKRVKSITPPSTQQSPAIDIAQRTITTLTNTLNKHMPPHSQQVDVPSNKPNELAVGIESILAQRYHDSPQLYRQHVRDICQNLAQNQYLCSQLLYDKLSTYDLVYSNSNDLATDEIKNKRNELHELSMKIRQVPNDTLQSADDIQCPQCQQYKVLMSQSNVALTNKSDTWGSKVWYTVTDTHWVYIYYTLFTIAVLMVCISAYILYIGFRCHK